MDIDIRKLQNELKRSGKDVVCIPSALADELKDDIYRLLRQFINSAQGSEYSCAFCLKSVSRYGYWGTDEHRPDCVGKRLLAVLDDATNL